MLTHGPTKAQRCGQGCWHSPS